MTVGTRDTRVTTNIGLTMSGNPSWIINGSYVTWSGQDSTTKRRPKGLTRRERTAYYLELPKTQLNRPYAVKRTPVDVVRSAELNIPKGLWSRVLEKRFSIVEPPQMGDYGTPHNFSKSWISHRESPIKWGDGSMRYWYGKWVSEYTGSITTNGWYPSTTLLNSYGQWQGENDSKLLERLRNRVVGTDFNLGSFLGAEGLDTLAFVGDVASRFARALVLAKRGKLRQATESLTSYGRIAHREVGVRTRLREQRDVYAEIASRTTTNRQKVDALAGQYLEFHLAAEPLLGDVQAAFEQLAHVVSSPRTQRVTASVTQKVGYPQNLASTPRWTGYRRTKKSVVAYFLVAPDPINFLGLQDPEVVIWNAIPLTFVSDYFYDIGQWLEDRATAAAFGTATYVTSFKDDWVLGDCTGMNVPGANHYRIPDALDLTRPEYRRGSFTRTVSSSLSDLPQKPRFKPLGVLENWQRAATAVSLATVLTSRETRRHTPIGVLR